MCLLQLPGSFIITLVSSLGLFVITLVSCITFIHLILTEQPRLRTVVGMSKCFVCRWDCISRKSSPKLDCSMRKGSPGQLGFIDWGKGRLVTKIHLGGPDGIKLYGLYNIEFRLLARGTP